MKSILLFFCSTLLLAMNAYGQRTTRFIARQQLDAAHFGNDRAWYEANIPYFECSDHSIQEVYYYRWKLFKAHLKNLGEKGYIVTEFLNNMVWDLEPYNSLNDATGFHIYEGRWLNDPRYIRNYIDFMYRENGNDRHFSEAIADAAYAFYLVQADPAFITAQLPFMVKKYQDWNDHYDKDKKLYFIEPIADATEYTISSIDASGGKDGFRGGYAFRPSINSYMYANAVAIRNIALLANDTATAHSFQLKALSVKNEVQKSLWNDSLEHFIDRYQRSNKLVTYWNFIRGRELVGYVPWTYDLPDDTVKYAAAWKHVLDTTRLMGRYGLRTNEPSYQYYMKQYRYDKESGLRECQWNGPSWPFQTSQVLLGIANLLNNYTHQPVSKKEYVSILRQYSRQHFQNNTLNIAEDYDPDKGGPIVNLNQRSEHYNHSEYNDLVITGLCGLRPAAGNTVVINPLTSTSKQDAGRITYFCLENVRYHGHKLTILYDETGNRYHQGRGLSVYVNGEPVLKASPPGKKIISLPPPVIKKTEEPVDLAINLTGKGFPKATASFTDPASKAEAAIDGRTWYFSDVVNRWSCNGSGNAADWYQVEFESPKTIHSLNLCFYADGKHLAAPHDYQVLYWSGTQWAKAALTGPARKPIGNTGNRVNFKPVQTSKVRVNFTNAGTHKYTALAELELF